MASDDLIDRLAAGLRPVRPRSRGQDLAVIAIVCLAELTLFFLLPMMRDRMPGLTPMPMPMPMAQMPIGQPSFWWKLVGLLLIATVSGAAAIRSFRPPGTPRRALGLLAALVAGVFAAGWAVDAAHGGTGHLLARLDWRNGLGCAAKMAFLAIPPMIGMAVLMRRGAATDAAATAVVAGLAAAAWGAFVFVFACPSNDPFYIAVWYTVGCGGVTLAARLLLPRLTRW